MFLYVYVIVVVLEGCGAEEDSLAIERYVVLRKSLMMKSLLSGNENSFCAMLWTTP